MQDHCNETNIQRTHPFSYKKAGTQHLDTHQFFPRPDCNDYRLQHNISFPDDI
jgi:hypothetical protein